MARTKASAKEAHKAERVKVTLSAGLVGKKETHRKVVRALGLGKFGSSVVHTNTATIAGMLKKISHLIKVEPAK